MFLTLFSNHDGSLIRRQPRQNQCTLCWTCNRTFDGRLHMMIEKQELMISAVCTVMAKTVRCQQE